MLAGAIAPQVRPAGTVSVKDTAPQTKPAGTVSVRVLVPVNPLSPTTVMVDVADAVASTAAGELAAIVKSVSRNVAVAECERVPLVPVIVTAKVPAVAE